VIALRKFAAVNWVPALARLTLIILFLGAGFISLEPARSRASAANTNAEPPLLSIMQQELDRAMAALGKADPAAYFVSYSVTEVSGEAIVANNGAITTAPKRHERVANISVRVGSQAFDNTHGGNRFGSLTTAIPLEDEPDAIARELWLNTDRLYKRAAQVYSSARTNSRVQAAEEDSSPDFSTEKAAVAIGTRAVPPPYDQQEWANKIRRYSAIFNKYPEIETSTVVFVVDAPTEYFVSSEGARVVSSRPLIRILAIGTAHADDGMELARAETFEASTIDKLPSEPEIIARIEKIAGDLKQLRTAPITEPFSGPALLSGRAAAVFFHEVVGHCLEGQRQRGPDEGQTFTKKINQSVLPPFLSVEDDPTLRTIEGIELSGKYDYDEEGRQGERVELITNGVLKQFLMSRLPVKGFMHSNGHGRAQVGMAPAGRQGNLIVRSSNSVPDSELRARLIEEIKKQKKPYGLYFEDIAGGFTLTQRGSPQAFQIRPLMVWRVYPDGRPDELVRGVDIIGTPLTALGRIMVTGQKLQVFNGECGAESGYVPVSAAAPAMLFSEIEVQKTAQGHDRPPILPPPGFEALPSWPGTPTIKQENR
jgi:predicted Zn-dependent protease